MSTHGQTGRLAGALVCALGLAACENGLGTQQGFEPAQPIAYSHALHAGQFQMDCKYCHFGSQTSRHAGVPPASVCMGCHAQVKKDSPEVQKIAQAVATNTPIEWVKVHRLPDFAYFNHASHIAADLACQTCHGPVQQMVRVRQQETMTMGWCLECHRRTELETAKDAKPKKPPTDCSACHR